MGNGTTCNLHLVKQNAKRKGEVSTRFFFLYFVGVWWGDGGRVGGGGLFTPTQKDFAKAQTAQTPTVECDPGVSSSCFMGNSWGKKGEPSWDPTCGARPQQQHQGKEGMKQAGVARADLFITTAPSLSPSRTANANVGHLGKK